MRKILFFLCALLILPQLCLGLNAPLASSARFEVTQDVSLRLSGAVQQVEVKVVIPQEDEAQKIISLNVSEPYKIITDEYGNKMVKVTIQNPSDHVSFRIRTIVEVKRRFKESLPENSVFESPTELIQSADPEIISQAKKLVFGTTDFDKISSVIKWVHENIAYDLNYSKVNLSAKDVLHKRAGVCDELSALSIALLRAAGYRSAYVMGYAYGRGYTLTEGFTPHGWIIACGKKCYPADPTWAEGGWLDATHIKFAVLPESYFIEAAATAQGFGKIYTKLENVKTKIKILNLKESEVIHSEAQPLDSELWNGYAVLKQAFTSDGCILTKVMYNGCAVNNKSILKPESDQEIVYFCKNTTRLTLFSISPDLNPAMIYKCGVVAAPLGGQAASAKFILKSTERARSKPVLSCDKDTVLPSEPVRAYSKNAYIFTKDKVGFESLEFSAPLHDFKIYAYSNGLLDSKQIKVVSFRPLDAQLEVPQSLTANKPVNITVRIKNLLNKEQSITLKFKSTQKQFTLAPRAEKIETFVYRPQPGEQAVQIFVQAGSFSTSLSKQVSVAKEKNFIQILIEAIANFIKSILGG